MWPWMTSRSRSSNLGKAKAKGIYHSDTDPRMRSLPYLTQGLWSYLTSSEQLLTPGDKLWTSHPMSLTLQVGIYKARQTPVVAHKGISDRQITLLSAVLQWSSKKRRTCSWNLALYYHALRKPTHLAAHAVTTSLRLCHFKWRINSIRTIILPGPIFSGSMSPTGFGLTSSLFTGGRPGSSKNLWTSSLTPSTALCNFSTSCDIIPSQFTPDWPL